MVEITGVEKHSRAAKAGIQSGDVLASINGNAITDVIDYRFYLADERINIEILRGGEKLNFEIGKETYDDIGLEFETPLMDKKHGCKNKCIFCFIDQLPCGMRDTLYFKDDDSRLSFLHGNYITLTNLYDEDIERIIKMHITPVNISVHTTNPELRVEMMKNPRAGEVLKYLKMLCDGGCHIRGQIVACKGVNDGEELLRSMRDLEELYPMIDSVSVVPAGLTKYRDKLYPLEPYEKEDCEKLIDMVEKFADECFARHKTHLFFAADELYIKCGRKIHSADYYEGFPQIENGVGMIASMGDEFAAEFDYIGDYAKTLKAHRRISIATGVAAFDFISSLCRKIESACDNISISVYRIVNNYFGENVTVAGLVTGVDIYSQLKGKDLGEELVLPSVMLRAEGDLFLCGMTPEELSEKLKIKISFCRTDAADFLSSVFGIKSEEGAL